MGREVASTADFNGLRVYAGKRGKRKVGKVACAVFHPQSLSLAGLIVKRPDLLLMFKRPDRFLALDRCQAIDGRVVASDQGAAWDKSACKRLGLDWDEALILEGMAVLGPDGEQVGRVDAVEYDLQSGKAQALQASSSIGGRALLGQRRIPIEDIAKQEGLSLLMRVGAEAPDAQGGLAAKAGAQAAKITNTVKAQGEAIGAAVDSLAEKAGSGMEKAGYQAGRVIGKARSRAKAKAGEAKPSKGGTDAEAQASGLLEGGGKALGRRIRKTQGMFKAFSDEYKKAADD
jgi:uncharacterized protein YrrD